MKKVSVIIPMYGVEKYIKDCLCSVAAHTYTNIECIIIDDCGSDNSYEIARYFIEKGHRSLAFIGPPSSHTSVIQQRFEGFCDELETHGIPFDTRFRFSLKSDVDHQEMKVLAKTITEHKNEFTGAFVTSDQTASLLMNLLRQNGILIPDDLSLISFDNLEICEQVTPQLTTIAQDLSQKAELSVDILFRRLLTPNAPVESMVLDVSLIERNSVKAL